MEFIINHNGIDPKEESEIPINEIPAIVYHYCSMESFLAIVKNRNIWLSNSYVLNDFRENTWINNYINQAISEFKTDSNSEFVNRFVETYNINNATPYVACFSSNGDVLSQWRAYANDATGVSIGFDSKSFGIKFRPPFTGATLEHTLGFCPVIYDHEIQRNLTKSVLPILFDSYKNGKIDEGNAIISAVFSFRKFAPIFKNPAFAEESEWRIIHTPLILGDAEDNLSLESACSKIDFRISNNKLVAHLSLPINDASQPIKHVILGPKNIANESLIQLLLNANGFKKIEIDRSLASYR